MIVKFFIVGYLKHCYSTKRAGESQRQKRPHANHCPETALTVCSRAEHEADGALSDGRTWLHPVLHPLKCMTYRLMGLDPCKKQDWKQYTFARLFFSLVGCVFTYAIPTKVPTGVRFRRS
jgi:hypothetical protein